jgi:hypothetical protein
MAFAAVCPRTAAAHSAVVPAIFSFGAFLAVIFFSAIAPEAKEVDPARAAERPVERGVDREQYPAGCPSPDRRSTC